MRRRLHDRLLYIVCSQNWDALGPHYWIKQCIELLLVTASPGISIQMSHESSILPSITSVINSADKEKRADFDKRQQDNSKYYAPIKIKEEVLNLDLPNVEAATSSSPEEEKPVDRAEIISKMIKKHYEFIEVSRNVTTDQFLIAASQLCHMDTGLAEQVWLNFFPRIWEVLEEEQRNVGIFLGFNGDFWCFIFIFFRFWYMRFSLLSVLDVILFKRIVILVLLILLWRRSVDVICRYR